MAIGAEIQLEAEGERNQSSVSKFRFPACLGRRCDEILVSPDFSRCLPLPLCGKRARNRCSADPRWNYAYVHKTTEVKNGAWATSKRSHEKNLWSVLQQVHCR
jgi:hypothetical protein